MKHTVVALSLHSGAVILQHALMADLKKGTELPVKLANVGIGIWFVFESKKAARASASDVSWGKDIEFVRIKLAEKQPQ